MLPTKVHLVKAMVFPVVMYGCDSWTIKKAERRIIDAFELWCWRRLLRVSWRAWRSNQSVLKEILNIHWKDWCWSSNTWPPDAKSWLIRKDSVAGKDWRQEENGMAEDEMVEWHHRLDGHEFEQAPGGGEEQGSLVCCSSWGLKESDTTEWRNNNNLVDINFIRNVTCIGDSWTQFYQQAPEDSVRIWAEEIWKRSWRVKQMIHLRYLRYLTSSTGNKMEGSVPLKWFFCACNSLSNAQPSIR